MERRLDRRRMESREERGAVIVILALMLVVLLSMLSLVVDVAALHYRKIALQNAADAAALAAANACGTSMGTTGAEAEAEHYTTANSIGAVVESGYPVYSPMCDAPSGEVTVSVTQEQPTFFAGIFGNDGTVTVRAAATAMWGGAGVFEHIAPLMLSSHRLSDCDIPPEGGVVDEPTLCTFYWDNSSSNPRNPNPALTNAEWGTLDLNNWNVPWTTHCNQAVPGEFATWMFQGFSGSLPIESPTTYVCRGQGNFGNSLNTLIRQAITDELLLYFPVNDQLTQVDRDGVPCLPATACSVDKYNIIGFARLRIVTLWSGKAESLASPCATRLTGVTMTANSRCMIAEWTDYTNEGLNPSGGANFGLVPVRLTA